MHHTQLSGDVNAAAAEIVLCAGGKPTATMMRIGGRVILGRRSPGLEPVDVDLGVLPEGDKCSPKHACIWCTADGFWWVEDLGSHGGTYLRRPGQKDNVRITGHQRLGHGDLLVLANVLLQFRIINPPAVQAVMPASPPGTLTSLPAVAATGIERVDPLRVEKLLCVAAAAILLLLLQILVYPHSASMSHKYITAGIFTAVLCVTDNHGAQSFVKSPISVRVPDNASPEVRLKVKPAAGVAPLDVYFDASASHDTDGTIERFDWDMDGDANFELRKEAPSMGEAAHSRLNRDANTRLKTFLSPGVFYVSVKVTDNKGTQQAATARIIVNAPERERSDAGKDAPISSVKHSDLSRARKEASQPRATGNVAPIAILNLRESDGIAPLTVEFSAARSHDTDGIIKQYAWDYDGDGIYDDYTNHTLSMKSFCVMLGVVLLCCGLLVWGLFTRRQELKRGFVGGTICAGILVLLGFMLWLISWIVAKYLWRSHGLMGLTPLHVLIAALGFTFLCGWVISLLRRDIYNMRHGL